VYLAPSSSLPTSLPIDDAQFTDCLSALGPFAMPPRLAVATSGGADSLALCLLAAQWVSRHRGSLTALTVDHGLRPEAVEEAREIGLWLRKRRIDHRVLPWRGSIPTTGIQQAARHARYQLLSDWCRKNRVLHLLLGHQCEDQAETLLLRLSRGSGFDGLAAMPALVERDGVRHLRPLLGVSHAALTATLKRLGQPWFEDPSNDDHRFARVRIRQHKALNVVTSAALARSARMIGHARAARDAETSRFLATNVAIDWRGFCRLDRTRFADGDIDIVRRSLARVIGCVGGAKYPVRRARLARLVDAIRDRASFVALTLGGCRVIAEDVDYLLVCREAGRITANTTLQPGTTAYWDGRFTVALDARISKSGLRIAKLANHRWLSGSEAGAPNRYPLPPAVVLSLPAIFSGTKLVAVPHLGLYDRRIITHARALTVGFAPHQPLTTASFVVA